MKSGKNGNDGNDGDGDCGEDDDDNNNDDDSGNRRSKKKRTGASRQTSLPLSRAPDAGKRKQLPRITPPRNRATGITRKRKPGTQKDVSKKAIPRQTGGNQQYSLHPKILRTNSRIKAEKIARDKSSRDQYEEEEEF